MKHRSAVTAQLARSCFFYSDSVTELLRKTAHKIVGSDRLPSTYAFGDTTVAERDDDEDLRQNNAINNKQKMVNTMQRQEAHTQIA